MDDAGLSPRETELIAIAREFGERVVAPDAARWEAERIHPREAMQAAAAAGLKGVFVPESLGGAGLSHLAAVRVAEALAAHCMAFAFAFLVHNYLTGAVARLASAEQRERLLPSLLRAEKIGAFCLTEPDVGSDATKITTRADRDVSGWVLSGEKAWIANGGVTDMMCVYAQTDPDLGARGIACFLVDATTPGVALGEPYNLMGAHAVATAGIGFESVRLDEDALLVPPGEGFKAAMSGINLARVMVAAMCCGAVASSLDLALDYAGRRQVFGKPVAAYQGIQFQLADVATDLAAARLLTHEAASCLDAGDTAVIPAAHAKKFASRMALPAISACMQALGAEGYRASRPFARQLAAAKMTHYIDGTTEIQNVVIARDLLRSRGIDAG